MAKSLAEIREQLKQADKFRSDDEGWDDATHSLACDLRKVLENLLDYLAIISGVCTLRKERAHQYILISRTDFRSSSYADS